jgi:hypothetical protein
MTNDPLDPDEFPLWLKGAAEHSQFRAVLRLDRILCTWRDHRQAVTAQGYAVDAQVSGKSVSEVRRFLTDWSKRMKPAYMACSLPDSFEFPSNTIGGQFLREAVLPVCRDLGLAFSLMIGVRKQVNPRIRLAGDSVGKADLRCVENLCRDFLTTVFSSAFSAARISMNFVSWLENSTTSCRLAAGGL